MQHLIRRVALATSLALGISGGVFAAVAPPAAATSTTLMVAQGDSHSCALLATGKVRCWGYNNYGQLGNPANSGNNKTPVDVIGLTSVTQIAAGGSHTCAVLTTGNVKCWGYNQFGQLGFTGVSTSTPTTVPGLTGVTKVAVGSLHTCARQLTNVVVCWGYGQTGGLGNGAYGNSSTPVAVTNLTGASDIAAGGDHACAIVALGNVKCWGRGLDGELGNTANGYANNATPATVSGLVGVTHIAAGRNHSCMAFANSVQCFGLNDHGQLGNGGVAKSAAPVTVIGLTATVSLALGGFHSCAVLTTGGMKCWGWNIDGAIGNGSGGNVPAYTPVSVSGVTTGVQASASFYGTCVTLSDNTVKCWGYNNKGQVGDNTTFNANLPQTVLYLNSGSPPPPPEFTPLDPQRLMDTRPGATTADHQYEGTGVVAAGSTTTMDLAGRVKTPTDTTAVSLNVTATGAQGDGFLTVYPCDATRPNASNVNFNTGDTVANVVIAKIGKQGDICIYADAATHIVIDINGYFPASTFFTPLVPGRIIDTRVSAQTVDHQLEGGGILAAGATTHVAIAGRYGIPATATAVALNITVTGSSAGSYITVFPCGETQPNASTLNYNAGQTIANAAISIIGGAGDICVYTDTATHLLIDVNGYFPITSGFSSFLPARILDSRVGATTVDHLMEGTGKTGSGSVTQLTVAGRGSASTLATSVVLNITVTGSSAGGFVTVFPCGTTQPNASNLNYNAGQTIANGAIAKVGTNGQVCIYTDTATHLIVDVTGYYI